VFKALKLKGDYTRETAEFVEKMDNFLTVSMYHHLIRDDSRGNHFSNLTKNHQTSGSK